MRCHNMIIVNHHARELNDEYILPRNQTNQPTAIVKNKTVLIMLYTVRLEVSCYSSIASTDDDGRVDVVTTMFTRVRTDSSLIETTCLNRTESKKKKRKKRIVNKN